MIKVISDEQGALRADVPQHLAPLGWFLEQDIQTSMSSCIDMLAAVDEVRASGTAWEVTGNAHTVTIGHETVHIENIYIEDDSGECEVSTDIFKAALNVWLQSIKDDPQPNDPQPG